MSSEESKPGCCAGCRNKGSKCSLDRVAAAVASLEGPDLLRHEMPMTLASTIMSSMLAWTTGSEKGEGILEASRSLIHREGGSREEMTYEIGTTHGLKGGTPIRKDK